MQLTEFKEKPHMPDKFLFNQKVRSYIHRNGGTEQEPRISFRSHIEKKTDMNVERCRCNSPMNLSGKILSE